jgi:viroplasmin and RNaseH domain-containing protein
MAHNFYAVKRGFDKKHNKEITDLISDNWYEVAHLVKGYDNARYKGFDTEDEARTWLSVVDKKDAEKRSKKIIDKAKEDIGIETDIINKEHESVHKIAEIYSEYQEKLVKEYKKLGWGKLDTVGHLVAILVNVIDEVYKEVK